MSQSVESLVEATKRPLRYARRTWRALRARSESKPSLDPSGMWGRVYDLRRKTLVELDGFSLFVMPDDYIGSAIMQARTYEPHVTQLMKRVVGDDHVFLDVGANIGYFTLLLASMLKARGNQGRVISFEPNPQNVQLLFASLQHNALSNVTVHCNAASDAHGILRFTTVGSNGGVVTSHSRDQAFYLLVQSVVLDDALKHEPRIDLVKMDIEAHEPAALRGMAGLIARHRPKLITEFHPWAMRLNNPEPPEDYLYQLYALQYRPSIILPTGELRAVSSASEIMNYWESLGRETAHLDLFAEPMARSA